jgi:hypothetical protein
LVQFQKIFYSPKNPLFMTKALKLMIGFAVAAGFVFAGADAAKASKAEVSVKNLQVTAEAAPISANWYILAASGWGLVVPDAPAAK